MYWHLRGIQQNNFKSFYRFKNKRLACKDEIKSIIVEICRKMTQIREDMIILESEYGPVEKEIVYLGIKAMYKFVRFKFHYKSIDLEQFDRHEGNIGKDRH